MEDRFSLIFTDLVTDMLTLYDRPLPDIVRFREGYQAAVCAWERLESLIAASPFGSVEEEIAFFKFEKPQVTGLIEFFALCGQASVQRQFYPDKQRTFWKMELNRGLKFRRQHASFCRYMEEKGTGEDMVWFRASSDRLQTRRYPRIYNRNPVSTSPKDWEAARYCGSRLYVQFIEELEQ